MFTADMIAPCGLDCSLCQLAHDKKHPCGGPICVQTGICRDCGRKYGI